MIGLGCTLMFGTLGPDTISLSSVHHSGEITSDGSETETSAVGAQQDEETGVKPVDVVVAILDTTSFSRACGAGTQFERWGLDPESLLFQAQREPNIFPTGDHPHH